MLKKIGVFVSFLKEIIIAFENCFWLNFPTVYNDQTINLFKEVWNQKSIKKQIRNIRTWKDFKGLKDREKN